MGVKIGYETVVTPIRIIQAQSKDRHALIIKRNRTTSGEPLVEFMVNSHPGNYRAVLTKEDAAEMYKALQKMLEEMEII